MTESDDDRALRDTTKALESARELVAQLEEQQAQLSLGSYQALKEVAWELHQDLCNECLGDGADCAWKEEEASKGRAELWFSPVHQTWVYKARTAAQASGDTAEALLYALKVSRMAKRLFRPVAGR